MEHWHLGVRIALGLIVIAHGVAHLVGVGGLWGVAPPEGSQPLPDPALPWLNSGPVGKAMGLIWLLACLAFVAVGVLLMLGRPVLTPLVIVSVVSLVLSLTAWPSAVIGVVFNAALLLLAGIVWWAGRAS